MKQLFTSTHTRVEVRERAYYPLSRGGSWCVQGSAKGPVLQSVAAADQRLEDDSGTGGHLQLRLLRHLTSGVGGLGAQFTRRDISGTGETELAQRGWFQGKEEQMGQTHPFVCSVIDPFYQVFSGIFLSRAFNSVHKCSMFLV